MIIDLSMELSENILVYPGDPKVEVNYPALAGGVL